MVSTWAIQAREIKWNCEKLSLRFNEVPGTVGKEFLVEGCYQEKTSFLISQDCKNNPKECIKKGLDNKLAHPGAGIGSPAFVQCYRIGGRPRFLEVKISDKWQKTSTCFFKSEKSFMDYDTISSNVK